MAHHQINETFSPNRTLNPNQSKMDDFSAKDLMGACTHKKSNLQAEQSQGLNEITLERTEKFLRQRHDLPFEANPPGF